MSLKKTQTISLSQNNFGIFEFLKNEYNNSLNVSQKPQDEESSNLLQTTKLTRTQTIKVNIPYDPKLYPPDIRLCKEHALARRISCPQHIYDRMNGIAAPDEAVEVCDCCGYPSQNKQIPLLNSCKDLVFLGSGFPLFFDFMKFGIVLLFMILMISGLYNLITNMESNDCNDHLEILNKHCVPDYFTSTSLVNKANSDKFLKSQEVLNLLSVLMTVIFLQVLRYRQRKLAFECDLQMITASDYTLQVQNLPKVYDEEKIRNFFQNLVITNKEGKREKIKVEKINPSYYILKFMNLINQQVELSSKKLTLSSIKSNIKSELAADPENTRLMKDLKSLEKIEINDTEKLKEIEAEIEQQRVNFKTLCIFTQTAFITFQTPYQAQIVKAYFKLSIYDRFKRNFKKTFNQQSNHLFENHAIIVTRAPEPNEILWENLGVSSSYRFSKRIITWILTFFVLLLSFFAILAIYYLQIAFNESDHSGFFKTIVSYTGCFCIVILNNILVLIVTSLTSREKLDNSTEYDISLVEKKTAALFLNSACIYILVAFYNNTFFGTNGLIYNILSVFLSNMFMQPLLYIFSPYHFYKRWKQSKMLKDPKAYPITQQEANILFEGVAFDITVTYSSVLNLMLFAAFYAPLVPLSLIFAIITLIVYYWTFKYLLLRRCSTPSFLGKRICYEAIEIMEFVPLFLALGDIFFNLIFYGHSGFITYVSLAVSTANFIFPMAWLNKQLMPFEEKKKARLESPSNIVEFSVARLEFTEEYDRSNPVTQLQAKKQWIDFIERRNMNGSEFDGEKNEQVKRGGFGVSYKKPNRTNRESVREDIDLNSGSEFMGLTSYATRSTNTKGRFGFGMTRSKMI